MEAQVIEYRAGNSPDFSTVKMPGLKKSGNITMKKGVFAKDNALFDWFNEITMNVIKRKALTISLLDEGHNPTMVWKVAERLPGQDHRHRPQGRGQRGGGRDDRDRPRGHHHRERLSHVRPSSCRSPSTSRSPSPDPDRGADAAFQEVGGLEAEIEVETVVEGGENRFAHRLPKPVKPPEPDAEARADRRHSSGLVQWCKATFENDFSQAIQPKAIVVSLCDAEGEPVASWSIGRAYPGEVERRGASTR